MEKRFIITAVGKDRPGIVADVTEILFENGCNLEDSSMTLLADEFALILLCSGRQAGLEETLATQYRQLEKDKGISATIKSVEKSIETVPAVSVHCINVEGQDQAGIMYKVSRYLADHRINIVDLRSRLTAAPESGTPIYTMEIQVQVPDDTETDQLRHGLTQIADKLHVDISCKS